MTPPSELLRAGGIFGFEGVASLSSSGRFGYGVADPQGMDNPSLARLARTLIGRHFARLRHGGELAALLNVELDRLVLAFRGEYHMSLDDGIASEKFRMAQRLLAETSLGLPEIARRVGFEHPSDFATAFHELIGISPWAFRQLPYHEQIAALERSDI